MNTCKQCSKESIIISASIGYCLECIRKMHPPVAQEVECVPIKPVCSQSVDKSVKVPCIGFVDQHPANCTGSWLCPGTTGCGYPRFALSSGCEVGCQNLGVFFGACDFRCRFCQDWIHELMQAHSIPRFTLGEIIQWVDEKTTCVCFCGGNPDLYLPEIIWLCERYKELYPERVLRFCSETNLTGNSGLLKRFAELVLQSGGGLNISIKASNETLHHLLTGTGNKQVYANLKMLHDTFGIDYDVPFLRPSLLLIPGYIDEVEITSICAEIAALDPRIPFKFLPFFPRRHMSDLPPTSDEEMRKAIKIANKAGLLHVSPKEDEINSQQRFVEVREELSRTLT